MTDADTARLDWLIANADPTEAGLNLRMYDNDEDYRLAWREAIDRALIDDAIAEGRLE